jgi:asparagine synthase (glutamine-hydrolysing)
MSLYYSPSDISEVRLKSVAREIARQIDTTIIKPGPGGFLWVGRDQHRFGPAYDPATGVRVVCSGHVAWSAHDWSRAQRLPYEGGLGPCLLLERYLKGGVDAVAPYNGSTIVVVHDPRAGEHHVCTDQFGYHPCFIYRGDSVDACIVTTFPDALLADPAASVSFDLVSMADFIRAWRITPPHTYFNEVKYSGAGVTLTIATKEQRVSRRIYWQPFKQGFYRSIGEASEALAAAVKTAIAERASIAERPLYFVSGGTDSRVMLFSTEDRGKATGVNIYEHAQQETEIARNLCAIAGSSFVALQRDNDYYPRNLPEITRWSGAMWSAEDSHYPGFEAQLTRIRADLVMTACTTDWLFKGYGMEKEHVPFLGRSLPFLRYIDQRAECFLPNVPLPAPPELAAQVNERMAGWFEGCPDKFITPEDRLIVEDRRIRPACYTVSVSGQIMYRIYPYDTFFADTRVAECYGRIHPDWKLNREVWGKAVARICAGAGNIVDANWGWRVDARRPEKALVFVAGWFRRRLKPAAATRSAAADRPPPAGSWPDFGWYAEHSPTLKRLWQSATGEERERMRLINGTDHWSHPLESWRSDGLQLFRLLTLLCHWRECDRRRRRVGLSAISEGVSGSG